jgi:hypothetical protein
MQFTNIKIVIVALAVLLILVRLTLADSGTRRDDEFWTPELPPVCGNLQVPAGNKMHFRVYAVGVQIYRWNGASWDFVAPVANLYADEDFHGKVGFHYAGPTWESNSGSRVVGRRLAGCSPDASAIPWLLLETVSSEGPGIFKRTTFIQRVNTAGGLAPATPGAFVGAQARVPYTTEYYFYRAEN